MKIVSKRKQERVGSNDRFAGHRQSEKKPRSATQAFLVRTSLFKRL